MYARRVLFMVLLLVFALSGCSKKMEVAPPATLTGEQGKAGAMLAYEHRLSLQLPADAIAPRLAATRSACESAQFGACNVLRIEQSKNRAELVLRIVPAGVEPLVALAAQGGEIGERETSAEDLAQVISDNHREREQLQAHTQHLSELAARRDIAVADLIAISREQANIDSRMQELELGAAVMQHRLDTNKVTLSFTPVGADNRSARVSGSFSRWMDRLTDGIADALDMFGYGLPFLLLAFPLLLLWRWLWRKVVSRRS
ncbi:DUF4349 domain-containing protein [Dyella tabacisoli]|uniref:DUF4349 domain-containing protein n=1 Tax=Dyella tabacisoli TaxID=2282381 RepID=A0A369US51_9GAMM|nr:DUF4349 domain-containing protein [Dyella tabacisoli]RDD83582.1 DUF4349 domain-containing protein [Dyella tabacisoli]